MIGGQWVESESGQKFKTINPANEQALADIAQASAKDVDKAVAAARQAFDKGIVVSLSQIRKAPCIDNCFFVGPWSQASGYERSRLLNKLADLIEKHAEELAGLEALDNGKAFTVARDVDVAMTVQCFRYYAGWADKVNGNCYILNCITIITIY